MISSVAFAPNFKPVAPAQTKRADEPTPTPDPAPQQPSDAVSFDVIDCPVKAACLPVMDPGVITAIVAGAFIGGSNGVMTMVAANIQTGSNPEQNSDLSSRATSSFTIDPKDQQKPITSGGLLGNLFDSGSLTVDMEHKTATWKQVGDIELTFSAEEKKEGGPNLRVDGHLGTVEAHLQFHQMDEDLPKDAFGICTHGTLGGQPYMVDSVFTVSEMKRGDSSSAKAHISASGRLGDAAISKEYDVIASQDGQDASLAINGQGTVAGVPVKVDVEAHIAH